MRSAGAVRAYRRLLSGLARESAGRGGDTDYLPRLIALARRYGFVIFADECYSEIYCGAKPPACWKPPARFRECRRVPFAVEAFEPARLARRFRAGDRAFLRALSRVAQQRRAAGADAAQEVARPPRRRDACRGEPQPLCGEIRSRRPDHRRSLRLQAPGRRLLPLARRVGAGGSEAATAQLVARGRRAGPARAISRTRSADGINPGADYIRVALVHDNATTAEALHRLVAVLGLRGRVMRSSIGLDNFDIHFRRLPRCDAPPIERTLRRRADRAAADRGPRARHLVGAGPEPQPRHQRTGPQPARLPGAIAADLMMQLLGLASVVLVLPVGDPGAGGWSHIGRLSRRLRLLLWIAGAVFAAAFASCLPRTASWPLPTGLGGVIGDALLQCRRCCSAPISAPSAGIVLCIIGVLAGGFRRGRGASGVAPERRSLAEDITRSRSIRRRRRAHLDLARLAGASLLSLKARHLALVRRRRRRIANARRGPSRAPPRRTACRADPNRTTKTRYTRRKKRKRAPAPRKARAAHRAARASRGGYVLPSLDLLAAAKPPTLEAQHRARSRKTPTRWKACWRISACTARSSMRAPARW